MSSNIVVAVVALTLVVIAILFAIVVERQRRRERIVPVSPPLRVRKRSHTAIAASNIPPNLGVHPVEPFERLAKRVERALDADYHQKLKHRVMTRYPHFSDDWFEWVLFELKRYFVLNLVLPRVPMFSETCDDVWHEMLMFTRDYQRFCEQIAGTFIHHTPYGERKPMPDEKAWFDWVYTHLYALTPYSAELWKGFFHHPLPKEQIAFFAHASVAEIRQRWFNAPLAERDAEVALAIDTLIHQVQNKARYAETSPLSAPVAYPVQESGTGDMRDLALLWLSASWSGLGISHPNRQKRADSSCGGCGGIHVADADGSDANGDGGDGSGCGGSCGGCGGSCGS